MGHIRLSNFYLSLTSFCLFIISLAIVSQALFIYHFNSLNLFIFELLNISFEFHFWYIFLFSILGFGIFCWISWLTFPEKYNFYPPLVFAFSPWFSYLAVVQSFYIYLLLLILLSILGIALLKTKYFQFGLGIFLFSIIALVYSSPLLLITLPFLVIVLIYLKLIPTKHLKKIILILTLSLIPLMILIIKPDSPASGIFKNQIRIFSNPGLLAQSNRLQGDSKKAGYVFLARLAENKYLYLTKYSTFKVLKNLNPLTFFSIKEKLLDFSFTPTIFLGFLIPFFYGLYLVIKNPKWRGYLLFVPILAIPAFLSDKIVDLNRLILDGPFIIFIISLGLVHIKLNSKHLFYKVMLFTCIGLVLLQLIFTIWDIYTKEDLRYQKNFTIKTFDELGRQ